ncbi:P-loop containing nucleoside triphosphate hydrolase [Pseudocohnilembus persalinus]|uniref:p-loop containing nucleoside triphosphate hydrolase n=1 Tax=Pseudocohnilembus persalinus TaxID=266149 RepID=A0A0V0QLZ2_PSEPJ|nr:P-loop containing nucleoside triphosphate hydrolase [Pseudocohnilembus persalinus]|eukprot:KRX03262.1 P-loop containing nucleoside triphosphate hydrolase [Pseudocohnilembus persalinus]
MQNEQIQQDFSGFQIKCFPPFVEKAIIPIKESLVIKSGNQILHKIQYSDDDRTKTLDCLPIELKQKLYAYQKQGIEFGLRNLGRILIGDEMGVGKTIQSIALAYCYYEKWPLLVVSPSSLRLNWKDEILMWLPDIKENQVQVISKGKEQVKKEAKVIIISYDLCVKFTETFRKMNIQIAIADEAHYLKNSQAKRTEALTPILCRCQHILLLTGTPALARPKEIFSLISIIRPDVFFNFRDFGNRYCDPKPSTRFRGIEYEGSSNPKELNYILRKNIMVRRLKKDVLQELPPKRRQRIKISTDQKVVNQILTILNQTGANSFEKLFKALRNEKNGLNEGILQNDDFIQTDEGGSMYEALTKCYLLTGKAKIPGILEYIHELLENDVKFIIFAHHLEVLDAIQEYVQKHSVQFIRIDGGVGHSDRHTRVKSFQENENVKVAILSITAAGTGLTLTATSNILFAEMHWTPAVMQQAEDRAHRIGQINCVNCHYLIGENTIDEKLYDKLLAKFSVVSDILDQDKRYFDVEEHTGKMGAYNVEANHKQKMMEKEKQKLEQGQTVLNTFFKPKNSLIEKLKEQQEEDKQRKLSGKQVPIELEIEDISDISEIQQQFIKQQQQLIQFYLKKYNLIKPIIYM